MSTIEYDPCSEATYDDPYPFYEQLRREAPIFRHPDYRPWFLSRFDDIVKAAVDTKSFTVTEGTTSLNILFKDDEYEGTFASQDFEVEIPMVAMLDPPLHTRIRAAISAPFKPVVAETMEPLARRIVRERIALARETGRMDAIADLAGHLSVRIALTVLGLPLDRADQFSTWVNQMFHRAPGVIGMTDHAREGSMALMMALIETVQELRKNETRLDGLLDLLLYGEFEGRRLNDFEAAFHMNLVVVGGSETLPKVASAAIYRLWQHPDQRAECAADPGLIPQAFHEALRYDMPTQMLGRVATREVEFHGQTVAPGEPVMFLWPSGNRDEKQFDDPDRFDIHRGFPRILSFGQGAHTCLGSHIARMEGKVILEELLAGFPEYEVIEDEAVRIRSEFFRGFTSLPLQVA